MTPPDSRSGVVDQEEWVYVSDNNPWGEPHGTRPFHRDGCSYRSMPEMNPDNWSRVPKADALADGRDPCGRCNP